MDGESCGVRVLSSGESGGTVVPGKFFLKCHFFFFLFAEFEEKPVVLEYQDTLSSDKSVYHPLLKRHSLQCNVV